jgi:cytochrome c-type biogenesis protein CcmH/NrfF
MGRLALKDRRVRQTYAVALWNLPVCMLIFAALVCADCAIRKRRGMP